MKVEIIKSKLNREKINPMQTSQKQHFIQTSRQSVLKINEIPSYALISNSVISFGLTLPYNIDRTPCAYCKRPMLDLGIHKIIWPKGELEGVSTALYNKQLIETLQPFESYMHEPELYAFQQIKSLNAVHPDKPFQQLLEINRPQHLENLKAKEFDILDKIKRMSFALCPETRKKHLTEEAKKKRLIASEIRKLIAETKYVIEIQRDAHYFKRKVFLDKIGKITDIMPENLLVQKIKKTAESMPNCKTNRDAFIVKYSGKGQSPDGSWHYRTSQEISHNCIASSVKSLDHLNPLNPDKSANCEPGKNELGNAIGACSWCNNEEKGNTPLPVFLQDPEKIKNVRFHIGFLKQHKAEIDNADEYIGGITQTTENGYKEATRMVNATQAKPESSSKKISEGHIKIKIKGDPSVKTISIKNNPNNNDSNNLV